MKKLAAAVAARLDDEWLQAEGHISLMTIMTALNQRMQDALPFVLSLSPTSDTAAQCLPLMEESKSKGVLIHEDAVRAELLERAVQICLDRGDVKHAGVVCSTTEKEEFDTVFKISDCGVQTQVQSACIYAVLKHLENSTSIANLTGFLEFLNEGDVLDSDVNTALTHIGIAVRARDPTTPVATLRTALDGLQKKSCVVKSFAKSMCGAQLLKDAEEACAFRVADATASEKLDELLAAVPEDLAAAEIREAFLSSSDKSSGDHSSLGEGEGPFPRILRRASPRPQSPSTALETRTLWTFGACLRNNTRS